MGTRSYTYSVYSFKKPKPVSQDVFNNMNKSLPIYPNYENPFLSTVKKYWFWSLLCLFPPTLLIMLVLILATGIGTELESYYSSIVNKNKIMNRYYDIIYKSKSYDEYIQEYRKI